MPVLDRRSQLDLVEEILKTIKRAFKDAEPAPSREQLLALIRGELPDAGLMLGVAFARMMLLAIERLNRVPEKHWVAFLDLMGVAPLPSSAAAAPLTFALLPGAPATLIRKGARAGLVPAPGAAGHLFETLDELTVVPSALVALRTIDPIRDCHGDQLGTDTGPLGFAPFVGIRPLPHVLHLGNLDLLEAGGPLTVKLPLAPEAIKQFLRLDLSYISGGERLQIEPRQEDTALVFDLPHPADVETVQGVGLAARCAGRWLHATLPRSRPDMLAELAAAPRSQAETVGLAFTLGRIEVSAKDRRPDLAFADGAPVDVSSPFKPFGDAPVQDAIFAIASSEALAKPLIALTLHVAMAGPEVVWEYRSGNQWIEFAKEETNVTIDGAFVEEPLKSRVLAFMGSGRITLPWPMGVSPSGAGLELRVRVKRAGHHGSPQIHRLEVSGTRTQLADPVQPVQASQGQTQELKLKRPLAPFGAGAVLSVGHELFLARSQTESTVTISGTITERHEEATPVRQRANVIAGTLTEKTKRGQRYSSVVTDRDIKQGEIYLLSKGSVRELVTVERVQNLRAVRYPGHAWQTAHKKLAAYLHWEARGSPLWDHESDWSAAEEEARRTDMPAPPPHVATAARWSGNEVLVHLRQPLQNEFAEGTTFHRLAPPLSVVAAGRELDPEAEAPFLPFGGEASVGRSLQMRWLSGERREPSEISIYVEAHVPAPTAAVQWEYLSRDGWRSIEPATDGTQNFARSGEIVFAGDGTASGKLFPDVAPDELNGQKGYWLRARLARGDYGRPVAFEPVDPDDPSRGFRARADTGNLNPPIVESLSISYRAASAEADRNRPRVIRQNGFYFEEVEASRDIVPFVSASGLPPPYHDAEPTLYLGFDRAFPEQPVSLYVTVAPLKVSGRVFRQGRSVPTDVPEERKLEWDYFNGRDWAPLPVLDGTSGFEVSGAIKFLAPVDMGALARFDSTEHYWIRARTVSWNAFDPTRLLGIFLNTVPAEQSEVLPDEMLGSGTGVKGQTFHLARPPVLANPAIEVRELELPPDAERASIEREEGPDAVTLRPDPATAEHAVWVRWHQVPVFTASGPKSRHYVLDHATGRVTFGDGARGMVLPLGTNNAVARYRTGGGFGGNVGRGAIAQIKSPLPGVATVTNPVPAAGGADAEDQETAVARGPRTLSHRGLAVTASEIEQLAMEIAGTYLVRARALTNLDRELRCRPGWMTLLILPKGDDRRPVPGPELVRRVRQGLAARTYVGVQGRLNIIGAGYVRVAVACKVVPEDLDEAAAVRTRMIEALERFLHPLTGGPDGIGWEFGRDVYLSEVCRVLEGIQGVDHVGEVRLLADQMQERLVLAGGVALPSTMPEGSQVYTMDGRKAALLAERLDPGVIGTLAIKGFRPGDAGALATEVTVDRIDGQIIDLKLDAPALVSLVRRSGRILARNGALCSTVLSATLGSAEAEVVRCEVGKAFAQQLHRNERVTVCHPKALRIEAVYREAGGLALELEAFQTEVEFPTGALVTSLDHRVRLPLRETVPAGVIRTSLALEGFSCQDSVTIGEVKAEVAAVEEEQGIVYVDPNFLVTSGRHRIGLAFGEP